MVDEEIEHESYFINDSEPKKKENIQNEPLPLIPRKTKAQIWEDTVIKFIKYIYIHILIFYN
jgi:hypothetical protein